MENSAASQASSGSDGRGDDDRRPRRGGRGGGRGRDAYYQAGKSKPKSKGTKRQNLQLLNQQRAQEREQQRQVELDLGGPAGEIILESGLDEPQDDNVSNTNTNNTNNDPQVQAQVQVQSDSQGIVDRPLAASQGSTGRSEREPRSRVRVPPASRGVPGTRARGRKRALVEGTPVGNRSILDYFSKRPRRQSPSPGRPEIPRPLDVSPICPSRLDEGPLAQSSPRPRSASPRGSPMLFDVSNTFRVSPASGEAAEPGLTPTSRSLSADNAPEVLEVVNEPRRRTFVDRTLENPFSPVFGRLRTDGRPTDPDPLTDLDRKLFMVNVEPGTKQIWRHENMKKYWTPPTRFGRNFVLVPRSLLDELPIRFNMACPIMLNRYICHPGGRRYRRRCNRRVKIYLGRGRQLSGPILRVSCERHKNVPISATPVPNDVYLKEALNRAYTNLVDNVGFSTYKHQNEAKGLGTMRKQTFLNYRKGYMV